MFDLGIVHTDVVRPEPEALAALDGFDVPTLHEAMGRVGLMRPYIRPVYTGARLCGPAVTVLLQPGDNWMLHVAAEQVRPGDVVVAGCTTECEDGFFGELLATSMRAQGARGLVIDGGCRDIRQLEEMDFPVFSRAINSKGTIKATLGSVNVPVVCANALIHPGDVVIADHDGVVVVPKDRVAQVAQAAQEREDRERDKREKFRAGTLGLDLYSMRQPLEQAGLTYVD
ncbi:4-carboxy-4-hydroxy-2-oxoadipate aldolase/oxaloacetate decarboxylase [Curtobacterium sp. S6]|uniref:4-carboxy-4-hydroxy-2-oxoadipate aldolase/oxaloacetate decarboxylase n=1 Tax=Curtobacterium sp. S6 TaxID=1479623 RepID=UPI0004AAD1D7|nr:4-carboxy-4-hydroxy-2-oxoadipate aldolase/oxaloacetate decarboxylase [Curtobacterium sp. S6]